jgi:hypothetical protein
MAELRVLVCRPQIVDLHLGLMGEGWPLDELVDVVAACTQLTTLYLELEGITLEHVMRMLAPLKQLTDLDFALPDRPAHWSWTALVAPRLQRLVVEAHDMVITADLADAIWQCHELQQLMLRFFSRSDAEHDPAALQRLQWSHPDFQRHLPHLQQQHYHLSV